MWLGDLPKGPGVVRNCREGFSKDREWLGVLPKRLGVVKNEQEALRKVHE